MLRVQGFRADGARARHSRPRNRRLARHRPGDRAGVRGTRGARSGWWRGTAISSRSSRASSRAAGMSRSRATWRTRTRSRRPWRSSATWTCSWSTPGITHYRPFAELPLDEARQMNDVNWLGTIHTVRAALPRMIERRRGHIVIISSGGGVRGFPHAAVYNGTKAAQRVLRRGAPPRAPRHRRLGHDRVSRRDRDLAARPRAGPHAGLVPAGPPRAGRAARGAGGRGRGEGPPRALLSAARAHASRGERRLAAARRPHAAGEYSAGARRRDDACR